MIFIKNALQKIGNDCLIVNLKANNFFEGEGLRKEDFDQLFEVFQLEKNSLPLLLIKNGYDVWIGNNRGTIFSWGHTSKDPDDLNGDYWDFSMDENVIYDLIFNLFYNDRNTLFNKMKTSVKHKACNYVISI